MRCQWLIFGDELSLPIGIFTTANSAAVKPRQTVENYYRIGFQVLYEVGNRLRRPPGRDRRVVSICDKIDTDRAYGASSDHGDPSSARNIDGKHGDACRTHYCLIASLQGWRVPNTTKSNQHKIAFLLQCVSQKAAHKNARGNTRENTIDTHT